MLRQQEQTSSGSLSEAMTSRIWLVCIIISLVTAWCVLDSWNHDMSSQLYQMSEVQSFQINPSGKVNYTSEPFKYTLTLSFIQFAFLGVVYISIFLINIIGWSQKPPIAAVTQSLKPVLPTLSNAQWPALVTTHIFGSVLLQSLMMPAKMMSLSLFAATRAVEVPFAAGARKKIFGENTGPSMRTTALMFTAAWLLFFSYTQIAECLCVWSGFGVALSGMPLYVVYALLLTLPAANTVLQESVMVRLEVDPWLMQGIQNLGAAMLFVPILLAAHLLGYEDVQHAIAIITGHSEVYMTVLWLCVQTLIISAVTVGMILTMNSFWAVAAHSLRVVFWWSRHLQLFYLTSTTLLSVSRPHASLWSFIMVCGITLGLTAFFTDRRETKDTPEDKKALLSSSERPGPYNI